MGTAQSHNAAVAGYFELLSSCAIEREAIETVCRKRTYHTTIGTRLPHRTFFFSNRFQLNVRRLSPKSNFLLDNAATLWTIAHEYNSSLMKLLLFNFVLLIYVKVRALYKKNPSPKLALILTLPYPILTIHPFLLATCPLATHPKMVPHLWYLWPKYININNFHTKFISQTLSSFFLYKRG